MSEARFGPGGIPDWLEPTFRFCSRCGGVLAFGPVEDEERSRLACPNCGFVCYVNPRLVVTTLPITDRGEVILIKRGIAPGLGQWAQPGGFLEIDETVRDAAIRETLEETGLRVEPGAIVGLYSRVQAAVAVVAYEARIVGGAPTITREALEIRPFTPEAIPWREIAFETSVRALRDWVAGVRPDLPLPDLSTIHRPFGA
ncbi:MAG: NUDIX domain-containing protein [Candidatus Limnocylindrales bacterium]|jgi:ADP-ribose pyrophosphatase YjhB (NUDIX family)